MIAIIGGGVIGLSIAWHLAKQDQAVTVFEKGEFGGEASFAAAGMITPASEVRFGEEELLKLFLESLSLYPAFVSNIEKSSGCTFDFHSTGSLMVAIDKDDEAELLRLYEYQKQLDLNVSLLSADEALRFEPRLSPNFHSAVLAPRECFLDNVLLITALKKAVEKAGGKLFSHTPVEALEIKNNRLEGLHVNTLLGGKPPSFIPKKAMSIAAPRGRAFLGVKNEFFKANQAVLATGIHTQIKGLPDSLKLPIRPVKGQALDLRVKGSQFLSRAIRTIHRYPVYLVPRSDGRITVGATNEEMGLDNRVTAEAVLNLLYGAWKILPSLEECELASTWVGFRPTTPDHAPILGPSSVDGLHLSLGMYRHGILLAPVIGKIMTELICGKTSPYFRNFSWERFTKE